MASQADDPVSSHGPLIPSLCTEAEKYCITCGKSAIIDLCSRCKGVWYCDKKCQKADWPCHKLLCSKYAKVNEIEPLDDGYRAFLFRSDSIEPQIVILPSSQHAGRPFKVIELLCKPDDSDFSPSIERLQFGFNSRLNRDYIGKSNIQVTVRANYVIDGSKSNKSVFTSARRIGITYPPHYWAGNIVVQRTKPTSVTMADFRHTLDWFALYPQHPLYGHFQKPTAPLGVERFWNFDDIKGVVIAGDQLIKDESERFIAVSVPASHPIRGLKAKPPRDISMISPLSERIGRPMRFLMQTTSVRDLDAHRRIPTSPLVPSVARGFETDPNASCLVVCIDDMDLSVNDFKAMIHFGEFALGKVIDKLTMTPMACKEADMQRALDLMSWDNYMLAFDELGMPRPQRPKEEAFIDMRGASTPVGMNQGREMNEDQCEH